MALAFVSVSVSALLAYNAPHLRSTRPATSRADRLSFGSLHAASSVGPRFWALGLGLLSAASVRRVGGRFGSGRVIVKGRNYETNIKRKKGPAELKQAKLTAKHLRFVMLAVREAGPDPEVNRTLARCIRAACKDNVPRDTIDKRIKSFVDKNEAIDEINFSGYGAGGAALIAECVTDNTLRTRTFVKEVFKENDGQIGQSGCVDHAFKKLGAIRFEDADEEKVLEASMEAEAEVEDIVTKDDGTVEVTTLPENFHSAATAFESVGMEPASSETVMLSEMEATLNKAASYKVMKLVHELEELEDVGQVHHNAVFEEGVELQYNQYGYVLPFEKAYKDG